MGNSLDFGCIVLTPAGTPNADLAIAGCRAGALGVLNLEFCDGLAPAANALAALKAYGRASYGVLVDAEAEFLVDELLALRPEGLATVLVSNLRLPSATALATKLHEAGLNTYAVVTSLAEATAALQAGFDAVIAKGHEAAGWVGEETAFVLLQSLTSRIDLPVWVQGGIGLHSAAAAYVAGAAGVVLDSQVLLARESPLSDAARARIETMDGSETQTVGASAGAAFRAYYRPGIGALDELRLVEASAALAELAPEQRKDAWRASIRGRVDWQTDALWAVGQDATFASSLARNHVTVGGIVSALQDAVRRHCEVAQETAPFAIGAPLAESHGTKHPIVQGPMTRVSDRPAFAEAVAGAGALPFLALALMRGDEIRPILDETKRLLADRSWGVGILGFVPPELRAEQLAIVRDVKPPFALIAGGRPDQARALEAEGITTYLHVPSPGLLRMFWDDGARRFVFEGKECGGHVGPRTSFILWETMIDVLIERIDAKGGKADDCHVLFAGGVHDGLSAAMVGAMAAPLVERGVKVGVLMGTAYLFTREAVETGAIQDGFQQAAIDCSETVTLEALAGYATRCLPSPFCDTFQDEKHRLIREAVPPEELKDRLENLNIGRLRIAAKGEDRHPEFGRDPAAPKLVAIDADHQWQQGMYMIGQVAALRDATCSLAELHSEISDGSSAILRQTLLFEAESDHTPPQAAVAIVGMASILPGAPDLDTFWSNIIAKVDAVTEVPEGRWDWRQYFDADRNKRDMVYSRWGGFIDEVPFDPLEFGMPPASLPSIEPFQLLALAVVRDALKDAGYANRPFARERTSVILGAGGGASDLTAGYTVRSMLPQLFGPTGLELADKLTPVLPEWTEDSFAGLLLNVAAGRVANRFDFGGTNYTVDAACASSLAAIYHGVRDLMAGTSDVVVAGGIDGIQNPFGFLCFAKTQALSPNGRSRPFDADADGIAISEGFATVVLKRLEDAERDGDRIYAVIRGVGGSSDGRARGLTAPRPEGQMRALRRAYAQAGYSPATVGLIEAHGTGTVAGDQAEVESLTRFFQASNAGIQATAVGSVKSMIGHTKATAGIAGMIKVAKALHHRVLPPTLGVKQPNPRANFPESPFYVNSEPRPWVQPEGASPRRAGVSAFGFGGTNFHIALEEYEGAFLPATEPGLDRWPAELLVWRAADRAELKKQVAELSAKLEAGARPRLADLAYTLWQRAELSAAKGAALAVVAESIDELPVQLHQALDMLAKEAAHGQAGGVYFSERPLAAGGKVAFLFPGQGSQYVGMARELSIVFPEVRAAFDRADRALAGAFDRPLSRFVFPPPAFTPEDEKQQLAALTETDIAQPALGVTSLALLGILDSLGVRPEMTAGHSYGEFVALHAAGALTESQLLDLSEARGRFIKEGTTEESGAMAAVTAPRETLLPLEAMGLTLANVNSPQQTVVSGPRAAIEKAMAWCSEKGIRAVRLAVACAFHSPLMAPAQQRLAASLAETAIATPGIPVFSNTTGAAYESDVATIGGILADHLVRPVEFVREIEAMYAAGARLFVEVGPKTVLSNLTGQILGDREHVTAPLDRQNRSGIVQLLQAVAVLAVEGVPVEAGRLFRGRNLRRLDLNRLDEETGLPKYTPTTWLVSGEGARPANGRIEKPVLPLSIAILDGRSEEVPAPVAAASVVAVHASSNGNGSSSNGTNGSGPKPDIETLVASKANGNGASSHSNGANGASGPAELSQPTTMAGSLSALTPTPASPAVLDGPAGSPDASAVGDVMHHFQRVMQQFLQVQENVMLGMLGAPVAAVPPPIAPPVYVKVAAAPVATPYTNGSTPAAEAAAPGPKPAANVVTETSLVPDGAAAPAVAAPASRFDRDAIARELLAIVSDRTGYPKESLALEADLEADLGVDSIKRVEISGAILAALAGAFAAPPEIEQLSACRSLGQLIDLLTSAAGETAMEWDPLESTCRHASLSIL